MTKYTGILGNGWALKYRFRLKAGLYLIGGLIIRSKSWEILLSGLAASQAFALVAHAETYLTEEQALKAVFPGESFTKKIIVLTPDEVRKIEDKSGERVRNTVVTVWVSAAKNVVIVDEVLGKHEFITYAVGITAKRAVHTIEIMDYRETYGYQVRNAAWRQQFSGKATTAPLRLDQDIVNISGATLSSSHVTAGVRRVLQTYEIVHDRL